MSDLKKTGNQSVTLCGGPSTPQTNTMTLEEPASDAPSGAESQQQLVTPLTRAVDEVAKETIKVLHVDDEPDFADLTAAFLERIQDQFTVVTETNADAGLDRLDQGAIDCVVSDYQMPGTDGLEFLEVVREAYPDLPFILFTGKGSEEIASDAIAAGVTDYLQKDGGTDQYTVLANRIQNAIDQYLTRKELMTTLSWYQRLVEQNIAGIYLIQNQEFIYVNEKLADVFGYEQAKLIGRSPLDVVAKDDQEELLENLRKREQGEVDNIQYTLTGERKDGVTIEIEVHGGAVEFEGEPAVMGILLEINE